MENKRVEQIVNDRIEIIKNNISMNYGYDMDVVEKMLESSGFNKSVEYYRNQSEDILLNSLYSDSIDSIAKEIVDNSKILDLVDDEQVVEKDEVVERIMKELNIVPVNSPAEIDALLDAIAKGEETQITPDTINSDDIEFEEENVLTEEGMAELEEIMEDFGDGIDISEPAEIETEMDLDELSNNLEKYANKEIEKQKEDEEISLEIDVNDITTEPKKKRKFGIRSLILGDRIYSKDASKNKFKLTKGVIAATVVTVAVATAGIFGVSAALKGCKNENKNSNDSSKTSTTTTKKNNTEKEVKTEAEQIVDKTMEELEVTIEIEEEAIAKPEKLKPTGEVVESEVVFDNNGTAWLNEQEKQQSANIGTTIENGHQGDNGKIYVSEEEPKKEEDVGTIIPPETNKYLAPDGKYYDSEEDYLKTLQPEVKPEQQKIESKYVKGMYFETEADRDLFDQLYEQGYRFDENGELTIPVDNNVNTQNETLDENSMATGVSITYDNFKMKETYTAIEYLETVNKINNKEYLNKLKQQLIEAQLVEDNYQLVKTR